MAATPAQAAALTAIENAVATLRTSFVDPPPPPPAEPPAEPPSEPPAEPPSEPPAPEDTGPAVLRVLELGNSGPMIVSISPVNRSEVDSYNRMDSLAWFINRAVVWKWQFVKGADGISQVPTPRPRCRLMIDGLPVTDWQAPTNATTGVYTFSVTLELGHGVAYIEAENFAIAPMAIAFVCNDGEQPLAEQKPWSVVNRFEYKQRDIKSGAVQFRYGVRQPYAAPMKPRQVVQSNQLVSKTEWWVRHPVASNFNLTRRWALTPLGDVVIEHGQKYFHSDATKGASASDTKPAYPKTMVNDGPRYTGNLGYVADMLVRPDGSVYFVETNGRVGLIGPNGDILTEAGLKVRDGALKVHSEVLGAFYMHRNRPDYPQHVAAYEAQFEQFGDWSQVSGRHWLNVPWGIAVAQRKPDGFVDVEDGHEFWIADTDNHRILYADHWPAHSLDTFEPAHFPPVGYVQPPAPTGTTTLCDFLVGPSALVHGPWKCRISPFDGRLYWTNFDGNSIARSNLDGTGGEVILSCSRQLTNAQLGITSRLDRSSINPKTLRDTYQLDGPAGVATCVRPTALDFDSDGNLVFTEHYTLAARRLNLQTMVVSTLRGILNNNGGSDSSGNNEPNLVVDRKATCGPADDNFTTCWGGNSDRRFDKAGVERGKVGGITWAQHSFRSGQHLRDGPLDQCSGVDYAWGLGIGHGRVVMSGNASGNQYTEVTRRLPTDPQVNQAMWWRGKAGWDTSGLLTIINGPDGHGSLGFPTIDEIATWPDADIEQHLLAHGVTAQTLARAHVVAGGSTPVTLADIVYFVRWSCVNYVV